MCPHFIPIKRQVQQGHTHDRLKQRYHIIASNIQKGDIEDIEIRIQESLRLAEYTSSQTIQSEIKTTKTTYRSLLERVNCTHRLVAVKLRGT